MNKILMPQNSEHRMVNLFRAPYKKMLLPSHRIQNSSDDLKVNVDILFDTFLENYNNFMDGKMTKDIEYYKYNGIPEPSQYKAFNKLINFFKEEEFGFLNKNISYYYHNTKRINEFSTIGLFEFFDNLVKYDFLGQEKKVIYTSGSFWRSNQTIREKIISYLEILHKKDIDIQIYTNAKKTEDFMHRLNNICNEKSKFGLEERIPIHFIRCGNDFYFIEFPHTEKVNARLNMFMDFNDNSLMLNELKIKAIHFFDNLVDEAK